MPQTMRRSTMGLKIRIDGGDRKRFSPGEVIIGAVVRQAHVVAPNALVTIKLCGRAKSKITKSRGNNQTSVYRGRHTLIDPNSRMVDYDKTLYTGPMHIPEGGDEQAWPFAIPIPAETDHYLRSTYPTFMPSGQSNIHPLPPTFAAHGYEFGGGRFECYIEYWLEARLHLSGNDSSVVESDLPIILAYRTPEPPISISHFDMATELKRALVVSSFRLVPGMQDAELSFQQKRQTFFGSPKVPQFHFSVEIQQPKVLQLHHPDPIPFRIAVRPDWKFTSDVLQDVPQPAELVDISMTVESNSSCICEGSFSPHTAGNFNKVTLPAGVNLSKYKSTNKAPLLIPCGTDVAPLDVTSILNVRLPSSFYPTFTTFNIKHQHRMFCKATLIVAGQKITAASNALLKIKFPSGADSSWIQPPPPQEEPAPAPVYEPPPSFESVVQEDEAGSSSSMAVGSKATGDTKDSKDTSHNPWHESMREGEASTATRGGASGTAIEAGKGKEE